MKYLIIGVFLTILSASASAQELADSIYLFTPSFRSATEAVKNPAALITYDVQNVSTISLNYHLQKGHFRTVQVAESGREMSLHSNGISTLGQFKIAGYFNFNKTSEDSVTWNLRGIQNDAFPYYFAAGKANKYERLNYNFGGLATYNLLKDKLYLAVGADYLYNTSAGTIDPRASVQTFQFNFNPQILYQAGAHVFGAAIHLGYGKESNSVGYKNLDYKNGHSDRITYLIMGYDVIPDFLSNLNRRNNTSGFGFNYSFKKKQTYIHASLNYDHQLETSWSGSTDAKTASTVGKFMLNNYTGTFLSGINTEDYQHQLKGNFLIQNGYDYRYYDLNGLSAYKYKHQYAALYYTALKQSGSASKGEIGLNLIYDNVEKKSLASSISSVFRYLQPELNGTLYNRFADQSKLSVTLSPGVRLPFGNQVKVPVINNEFANSIVYPDYTYWSSTAGTLGLNAKYITPHLMKKVNSGFGLNANYIQLLKNGIDHRTSSFSPSGGRLDLTLSFNLYF